MIYDYWNKMRQAFVIGKQSRKFDVGAFTAQFGDYRKGALYMVDDTGLRVADNSTLRGAVYASTKLSIAAWVNPIGAKRADNVTYTTDSVYPIISLRSTGATLVVVTLEVLADFRLSFTVTTSANFTTKKSVGKLNRSLWNNVGATVDITAGTISLWINGVEEKFTATLGGNLNGGVGAMNVDISAFSIDAAKHVYFLDEVKLWNVIKSYGYFGSALSSQLSSLTEVGLIAYWRFTSSLADSINNVTLALRSGFSLPTIDTTVQYPYSTGSSWMFGIVDLRSFGTLSIHKLSKIPSNYSIAVCWSEGGVIKKQFLARTTGLNYNQGPVVDYKQARVKDAWLEYWADDELTTVVEGEVISITTSLLESPKSFLDEAPTTLGQLSLNQSIYAIAPYGSSTLNFTSPFPALTY